jgi:hypothetical protein
LHLAGIAASMQGMRALMAAFQLFASKLISLLFVDITKIITIAKLRPIRVTDLIGDYGSKRTLLRLS